MNVRAGNSVSGSSYSSQTTAGLLFQLMIGMLEFGDARESGMLTATVWKLIATVRFCHGLGLSVFGWSYGLDMFGRGGKILQ